MPGQKSTRRVGSTGVGVSWQGAYFIGAEVLCNENLWFRELLCNTLIALMENPRANRFSPPLHASLKKGGERGIENGSAMKCFQKSMTFNPPPFGTPFQRGLSCYDFRCAIAFAPAPTPWRVSSTKHVSKHSLRSHPEYARSVRSVSSSDESSPCRPRLTTRQAKIRCAGARRGMVALMGSRKRIGNAPSPPFHWPRAATAPPDRDVLQAHWITQLQYLRVGQALSWSCMLATASRAITPLAPRSAGNRFIVLVSPVAESDVVRGAAGCGHHAIADQRIR